MSNGFAGQNDGYNDLTDGVTNGDVYANVLSDPNDGLQQNEGAVGDEYLNQDISTMPNEASNMAMSLNEEPDQKQTTSTLESYTNGVDPSIYLDEETQMHTQHTFTTISSPNDIIKSPLDRGDVSSPFSAMESDADGGIENGLYDGISSTPSTRKGSLFGISTPLMSTTTPGGSSSGSDPELSSSSRKKRRRTRRDMPHAMLSRYPFEGEVEGQYLANIQNIQHSGEEFFVPCQLNQKDNLLQNQIAASMASHIRGGEIALNNLQQFQTNGGDECFVNPNGKVIKNEPTSDTETMPRPKPVLTGRNPLSVAYPASANGCELRIVSQPETQHRARYLTEGSRGPVKDASQQGYPKVELLGCEITDNMILEVFVGAEGGKPVKPHGFYQACKVTGRSTTPCEEIEIDGTKVIQIPFQAGESVLSVDCVGILKLRNADVEARVGVSKAKKRSQTARLVFRVELPGQPGDKPVVLQVPSIKFNCTQPPGPPEIVRKSCDRCSVEGNVEVFIIGKNFHRGTKVVFQDPEESDGSHWHKDGEIDKESFHQTHMVVKVPAYHDMTIQKPVNVQMSVNYQGRRCEPHSFTYTPLTTTSQSKLDDTAESSPMSLNEAPQSTSENQPPNDARTLQNVLDGGAMDNKLVISLLKSLLQSVQGSDTGEEQDAGSEIPSSLKKMITNISQKTGEDEALETPNIQKSPIPNPMAKGIQIEGVSIPPLSKGPPPLIRTAVLTRPTNINQPVLPPQGGNFSFGNTSEVFIPQATTEMKQPPVVKSEAASTKPSELWQQTHEGEGSHESVKQFIVSPTQVFHTINTNDIKLSYADTTNKETGNTFQVQPGNIYEANLSRKTSNNSNSGGFEAGGGMSDNSFHDNSANNSFQQTEAEQQSSYQKPETQRHLSTEGFPQTSSGTSSFLQSPTQTNTQQELGNTIQQSSNMMQQPGNMMQQPGNTMQHTGNVMQQPGNGMQQAGSAMQQALNTLQQTGNMLQQSGTTLQQPGITVQQAGTALQQPGNTVQPPTNTLIQSGNTLPNNFTQQISGNTFHQPQVRQVISSNTAIPSMQQTMATGNTMQSVFTGNAFHTVSAGNTVHTQSTNNNFTLNNTVQNQQTGNAFVQITDSGTIQSPVVGSSFQISPTKPTSNVFVQNQQSGNTLSSGNPVSQSPGNTVQIQPAGNAFIQVSAGNLSTAHNFVLAGNPVQNIPASNMTGTAGNTFIVPVNSFQQVSSGATFQPVLPTNTLQQQNAFSKQQQTANLQQHTTSNTFQQPAGNTGFQQANVTVPSFATSSQSFPAPLTYSTTSTNMDNKPVQLTSSTLNSMAFTFKANLTNTTEMNLPQSFQANGQNNNNTGNIQQQQRMMQLQQQNLQQYHLQPQQELAPVPQAMDVTMSMLHKADSSTGDNLQKFNSNTSESTPNATSISKQSSIESDNNEMTKNQGICDVNLSQTSADFSANQMPMFETQEQSLQRVVGSSEPPPAYPSNVQYQSNVLHNNLSNEQTNTQQSNEMQPSHVQNMIVDEGKSYTTQQTNSQQFTSQHSAMETETNANTQISTESGNIQLSTEQTSSTSFSMDNLDKLLQTLDGSENFNDISREDVQHHLQ